MKRLGYVEGTNVTGFCEEFDCVMPVLGCSDMSFQKYLRLVILLYLR